MRYLPLNDEDRRRMLAAIGVSSQDALFADVPPAARLAAPIELPRPTTCLRVSSPQPSQTPLKIPPTAASPYLTPSQVAIPAQSHKPKLRLVRAPDASNPPSTAPSLVPRAPFFVRDGQMNM